MERGTDVTKRDNSTTSESTAIQLKYNREAAIIQDKKEYRALNKQLNPPSLTSPAPTWSSSVLFSLHQSYMPIP